MFFLTTTKMYGNTVISVVSEIPWNQSNRGELIADLVVSRWIYIRQLGRVGGVDRARLITMNQLYYKGPCRHSLSIFSLLAKYPVLEWPPGDSNCGLNHLLRGHVCTIDGRALNRELFRERETQESWKRSSHRFPKFIPSEFTVPFARKDKTSRTDDYLLFDVFIVTKV